MSPTLVLAIFMLAVTIYTNIAGRPGPIKEYKRTCGRCGAEWYVPLSTARDQAPNAFEMAGAKMYRARKRAALFTTETRAAELQVRNLEETAARVRANKSCPQCGSQAFSQQMW
jgi:ribosomal protein S27AE